MEVQPKADLCARAMTENNSRMPEICGVLGSTKSPEALNDFLKEILQAKLTPKVNYNNSLLPD